MDYINDGKVSDEYTKELEDTVESLREDDGSETLSMTYIRLNKKAAGY